MQMISSAAGTRLAKARAAVVESRTRDIELSDRYALHVEFEEAAQDLADELIAQGFADTEGD